MDAIEALRQDVQLGRISADRLVDLIASQQQQLQAQQQQLQDLQRQLQAAQAQLQVAKERLAELEKQGGAATAKLQESFSVRAEEQRQQARSKKRKPKRQGRRGRLKTKDKLALAERTEKVYPEGVPPAECYQSHARPVWRLEQRRAVLVAYEIYRGPKGQYGQIPGVLGRSEYGLEVVTEIAHLVYVVGLSFDKVCLLLHFFQNLKLRKSQVDSLLQRLARHWEHEFDVLCTLLANSLVVHADETGWSLKSVWAFLSEKARVLLFGVPKNADTLKELLDPATFAGLLISDDAAVYQHFTTAQKCWAHLLRKAIKLTLQDPQHAGYAVCRDRLLASYRAACRLQSDQRFGEAGRANKVVALDDALYEWCGSVRFANPPRDGLEHDYHLLLEEVYRLLEAQELFTFVTAPPVTQPNGATRPVAGTNNEAERTLRAPAQARDTGRTDKANSGARRRTVLTSVLESLRVYLPSYTLESVLAELQRWWKAGQSCFERFLREQELSLSETKESMLDRLIPQPKPTPTG